MLKVINSEKEYETMTHECEINKMNLADNSCENVYIPVNLNQVLDMSNIYRTVAEKCLHTEKDCPVLYTHQSLPEKTDFLWIRSKDHIFNMIMVSDRLDERETIRLILSEIEKATHEKEIIVDEDFGFFTYCDDMSYFYLFCVGLSDSLGIKCPVLCPLYHVPDDLLDNKIIFRSISGHAENDMSQTTSIIFCDKNLRGQTPEHTYYNILESLTHEMRHAYQRNKMAEKNFEDYKVDVLCKETISLKEDLDAFAYTYRVFKGIYNINLFSIRHFSDKSQKEIIHEANQMKNIKYTLGLQRVGKLLAD